MLLPFIYQTYQQFGFDPHLVRKNDRTVTVAIRLIPAFEYFGASLLATVCEVVSGHTQTHTRTHVHTATKAQCKYRHGPTEHIGSGIVVGPRRARITEIRFY